MQSDEKNIVDSVTLELEIDMGAYSSIILKNCAFDLVASEVPVTAIAKWR